MTKKAVEMLIINLYQGLSCRWKWYGIFGSLISFQNGARKDENYTHGIIDSDLLEIVRDRLIGFQSGKFATEYNAKALEHIKIALMYMNRHVEDRIERNVLGTYKK